MTKRILITGSNGLTGQKLVDKLMSVPGAEFLATSRANNRIPGLAARQYRTMDITNRDQVLEVIHAFQPDAVINTAAMGNVDQCEQDNAGCDALNVTALEHLVEACQQVGAHLVHLSTDFVFDGKSGPYKESDEPNPVSYYGASKLKGEQVVMASDIRWSIVRTVLIYGVCHDMSRSNIVLWARKALKAGNPIKVVNDQYRTPTLVEDLVDGCLEVVARGAEGLYHISGKDFLSVLEIVKRVAKFYQLDDSIITPVSSDTLNEIGKRPPKTGFILEKAAADLGYHPRSFEDGLALLQTQLS